MYKPNSLREFLTKSMPDFARNPQNLHVYVNEGKIVNTAAHSLSFSYDYICNILIEEFTGNFEALIAAILSWCRWHNITVLRDETQNKIEFNADILDHKSVNLNIKIPMIEPVICVLHDADEENSLQRVEIIPHKEKRYCEYWSLWIKDKKLAEFSHRPDYLINLVQGDIVKRDLTKKEIEELRRAALETLENSHINKNDEFAAAEKAADDDAQDRAEAAAESAAPENNAIRLFFS